MKKHSTDIIKKHGFDVNFILDHETFYFIGYEIELNEPITINGEDEYLFRLDVDKKTGLANVYIAFSDDYDIGEDYTEFFDVDWLLKKTRQIVKEFDVQNSAMFYIEQYAEEQ